MPIYNSGKCSMNLWYFFSASGTQRLPGGRQMRTYASIWVCMFVRVVLAASASVSVNNWQACGSSWVESEWSALKIGFWEFFIRLHKYGFKFDSERSSSWVQQWTLKPKPHCCAQHTANRTTMTTTTTDPSSQPRAGEKLLVATTEHVWLSGLLEAKTTICCFFHFALSVFRIFSIVCFDLMLFFFYLFFIAG